MFNIEFTSEKPTIEYNEPSMYGRITLGGFSEMFISPICYWSIEEFQQHWQTAAERLLGGCDTTTFFTTMYDPTTANFLQMWPMYREGDSIRVHNQLLILKDLKRPFDLADPYPPYLHVDELNDHDEDEPEQPISTWNLNINDMKDFVNRRFTK